MAAQQFGRITLLTLMKCPYDN